MAIICPLFSGSTGNSTYIETKNSAILVDAGASARALIDAISGADGDIGKITAVAVTHEHFDHVKGLKPFLNKTKAALVASEQTIEALIAADKIPAGTKIQVIGDEKEEINGMVISRFATSHDCEGSSGYSFELSDGCRVSVCTDLGVVTDEVRSAISGSDAILIESNHDIEMLKKGPYPPVLKMRIMSDRGHISNNACAAELAGLLKSGTRTFILGHLSLKNNTPMLAKSCAEAALTDAGAKINDYRLSVASPQNNRVTVI